MGAIASWTKNQHRVDVRCLSNSWGRFMKVGVVGREGLRSVYVPEMKGEGWVEVAKLFRVFSSGLSGPRTDRSKSYLEAASIRGWPKDGVRLAMVEHNDCDLEVEAEWCKENVDFLKRCLVGRLDGLSSSLPEAELLQRWANKKWAVPTRVEVKDLSGAYYLFVLPSEKEAKRVQEGSWSFSDHKLILDVWALMRCAFRTKGDPREVWVRVLGLPVHLWEEVVFKEIGDHCGGFIGVNEATAHRKQF